MELRILSIDPGLSNTGWAVVRVSPEGLLSVSSYGISPPGKEFFKSVMSPLRPLYDEVMIESQPYIVNTGTSATATRNHKLHLVEATIKGMCIGAGIKCTSVSPYKARLDLGICSGDYNLNKKLSLEFCRYRLDNIVFKELAVGQRHHVADCVVLATWLVLSKGTLVNGKSFSDFRKPCERRENLETPEGRRPPPPTNQEERSGYPEKDGDTITVKQVRKHHGRN